ncbi:MAG: Ig-like domain-containing protein, partial [Planctomycetota bacterium]
MASTNVISGSGGPGTFNFTSTVVPPGTYTNLIAYFEPLTGAFAASDSTATPRSLTVSNFYPITTGGTAITQDFNSLPSTGSTYVLPLGWNLLEVGTGADTQHTAGGGGENSGNTYNYGSTTTPADRALGTLLTGSFTSTIGASFINNTGDDIASLNIAYTGEQWRLGQTGRTDSLTFEYSLDATSLNTGTWTAAPSLDFLAPFATTAGALDGNAAANRTALTSTISLLTIANNATFWIRWTDTNVTGSDDGLAVDDFSITPILATGVPTVTTLSTNPSSVSYGQSVTFSGTVVAQSGVATPSGRVEIRDGGPSGTLLATATSITGTDQNGAYSVTTSLFGAGTYSPRAYFVPDPAFRLSNSATTSLVVNPIAFTAGDVAVLQADEADNNSSFSILDINPTTLNQANLNAFTINGTTVDASLRIAGSFTDTGYLSLNNYGDKLVFTGITTGATTASVGTAGIRGVGTLSPTGAFAIPTTYLNGAAGSTTPFVTRGATTINNGEWYITDQSGTFIDSQIPPVIATNKLRSVRAFGGTVYVAQQSATTGESLVATLAAPTATSATSIAGLPTSTSVQDFYLIRSGDHGGQYDVLYVINNAVSATVSTINKFSLVGGTWTANGTYTTTFGGFSIAAIDSGEGAVLYVTSGASDTAGNSLYKLTDTAGFNSAITIDSPSNAILYTASGTKVLKGVALAPQVVTIAAPTLAAPPTTTLLTTSAVTLNGNILSDGNTLLTSRGFYLSTNPDPVANSSAVPEGGSTLGSFSSSFSGLTPDTVYYYVAYATNSSNLTGYTPVYSFRTLAVAAAPTVATPTASAILDTTATLNATVTADGGAPLTARGFIYSLSNDPVAYGAPSPEGGTSVSAYSLNISGLVANSTYYYVAYATNSAGTFITSPVQQFTTLQTIVPPTVTVQAATAVASTAVALSGNVTADGFSAITQRGFVYSTSPNPTTGDQKLIVSGTTGAFSGNVVGLTPGTLYYYRAFATNSLATSYSATTNSFTTLAAGTFGTNSVVVLQTEPQASGAAALSIVEYLPTGAGQSAVQAVALPTTVSATGNAALTQSISATSEGYLTRTQNGAYLLVTGYNAATGTSVPAASIDRIVGRIDPTGVVDTTTRSPSNTGSNNIRAATSVDGASLYISGTQGISLITFGTQPTTS